jgi:hypothetical protein
LICLPRLPAAGPIPASLLASRSLEYLNLANNAFSGDLGTLPRQLRVLNVSNCALDGRISGAQLAGGTTSTCIAALVAC